MAEQILHGKTMGALGSSTGTARSGGIGATQSVQAAAPVVTPVPVKQTPPKEQSSQIIKGKTIDVPKQKIFDTSNFVQRFWDQLTNVKGETVQGFKDSFGKGAAFGWDTLARPPIQAALNFNPVTTLLSNPSKENPSGKTLVEDNPITGQIGGLDIKQSLGLVAENAANLIGLGTADDIVKGAGKGVFSYLKSKGAKTLAEGAAIGGLGAGGYEAEQKDSTLKSIATQSAIGAGFGLGLGTISLGVSILGKAVAREGVQGLTEEATKILSKNGVLDETTQLVEKTKDDILKLKQSGKSVTFEEVLAKNVDESPNAVKINQALDELVNTEDRATSSIRKLWNTTDSGATNTKIPGIVDQRIPTQMVSISERNLLRSTVKNFVKGLKTGAKWATEDLQSIKKNAETFIKQAIPDTGITTGEAKRLLSGLANVANEKQMAELMDRAVSIAEASVKRDLTSHLKVAVQDVLSKQPKITPAMINKAGSLKPGVIAVAQKERNQVKLLTNFLKIGAKDMPASTYRSAASFLKDNPAFQPLSKDMVEAIAGVTEKNIKDFGSEDLGKLNAVVETLIAQGKARTQMDLIQKHQTIEGLVDAMSETATKVVDITGDSYAARAQKMENWAWTSQTWFDVMDGNVGALSKWKQTGKITQLLKAPVDDATAVFTRDLAERFKPYKELIDEVSPKLTKDSGERIMFYALKMQPGTEKALSAKISKEALDALTLTPEEMKVYGFMRKELDSIWPEMNAIMLETQGRAIGFIDNYFPMVRDYDSFDSVAQMIESPLTGSSLKKIDPLALKQSATFGSIKAPRTGELDQLADLKLDAFEVFQNYMQKATYFKNMELAIQNVKNVSANAKFQDMVGKRGVDFLQNYVRKLSSMGSKESRSIFDKYFSALKKNLSFYYLAKISTAAKQFSSGLLATGYIGPRYTAQGIWDACDAKLAAFANEKSSSLILRSGGDVDLFKIGDEIKRIGDTSFSADISRFIEKNQDMWIKNTVAKTDQFMATGVWLGAYKKGLFEFGDEARAIAYADDIIDRTQVSAHFKDISRAQNYSSWMSSIMPFQTFSLGQWNVIREDLIKATWLNVRQKKFLAAADSAGIALGLFMAMGMEEAVDYTFTDPEYRDDTLLKHYSDNILPTLVGTIPYVGAPAAAAIRGFKTDPYSPIGAKELGKGFTSFYDLLTNQGDEKDLWNVAETVGGFTGVYTKGMEQVLDLPAQLGIGQPDPVHMDIPPPPYIPPDFYQKPAIYNQQ